MTSDDLGRQAYQKLILGEYREATNILNKAIDRYPDDHKLYINRCYCSIQLREFNSAMSDAHSLIRHFPELPNGFFLRGEIYLKLRKYEQAERDFAKLLGFDTDEDLNEVDDKLYECQMQQILQKGYEADVARKALRLAHSTEEALAILSSGLIKTGEEEREISFQLTDEEEKFFAKEFEKLDAGSWICKPKSSKKATAAKEEALDPIMDPANPGNYSSLWVGSKDPKMTICGNISKSMEHELEQLFSQYGSLKNVIVNIEKKCIFVNYFSPEPAAKAMKELQNHHFKGVTFLIKYSYTGLYYNKKPST